MSTFKERFATRAAAAKKHWLEYILQVAHIIAFIVLITHLMPADIIEKHRNEGIGLFFLGTSLLFALWINWYSFKKLRVAEDGFRSSLHELSIRLEKSERYQSAFASLNDAFSEIHSPPTDANKVHHKHALQNFCTTLASTYTNLTGTTCKVCIKTIVVPGNKAGILQSNYKKKDQLKVGTIVRDASSKDRVHVDSMGLPHKLWENSDFKTIFQEIIHRRQLTYFFCNDLADYRNYQNTSFLQWGQHNTTYFPPDTTYEQRDSQWPLKYRSVIVAPIFKRSNLNNNRSAKPKKAGEDQNPPICLGFLCLDAFQKDVFNEKSDPHILFGCGEGIYDAVYEFLKLMNADNVQTT